MNIGGYNTNKIDIKQLQCARMIMRKTRQRQKIWNRIYNIKPKNKCNKGYGPLLNWIQGTAETFRFKQPFLWHSTWQHLLSHSLTSSHCVQLGEICPHTFLNFFPMILFLFLFFFWRGINIYFLRLQLSSFLDFSILYIYLLWIQFKWN